MARAVPPEQITAVVNVGDDMELHGLRICPDLDTVTYTVAGAIDPERGWGLAGESWAAMEALGRYGGQNWFSLGDRDLATHMFRTQRLAEGSPLTEVTAEITASWGLSLRLLPVTEDRLRTMITLAPHGPEVGFQEWFVGRSHSVPVEKVRFDGAPGARPSPGVLDALRRASNVVIAPSNPLVSIDPVLAVDGVRETVAAERDRVVAISPIVAGRALKGPADRLLSDLGHEASVVGVARLWAPLASVLVIDEADADLAAEVEQQGMRCEVAPTIMSDPRSAEHLAHRALASLR